MSNNNICIIGIDFSTGEDNSAIAVRCENCKEVIYMDTTFDTNVVDCKLFKRCPKCNIEFKRTLVYQ